MAETYRHTNLSTLIVHLFHLNFGTNLHSLAVCLPASPPLAVVSNNLGVYKQTSIIPTTVQGVILKRPPFSCVAGFNLSCGLQTNGVVSPTTFPTLDKLPISLGFAIFVCNVCVYVCTCTSNVLVGLFPSLCYQHFAQVLSGHCAFLLLRLFIPGARLDLHGVKDGYTEQRGRASSAKPTLARALHSK